MFIAVSSIAYGSNNLVEQYCLASLELSASGDGSGDKAYGDGSGDKAYGDGSGDKAYGDGSGDKAYGDGDKESYLSFLSCTMNRK